MYQILIIVLILICLIVFGFVIFLKKSQNSGLEKFKTYTTEKYEFRYPSDWSIKETAAKNKNLAQLDLKQNSAKEGEIGKWLKIVIYSWPQFSEPKFYSKDMVSGQLIIAGEKYDRVDFGSGLFLYNVLVQKDHFMFEFSYNSGSPKNTYTDVIESIIQSLKLGQQQKLLELSFSPYGLGHSDPPGVGTKITLYKSGKIENQQTSYKQEGSSYKPVPAITTTSNIKDETITKIEDIIKQLMDKDCAKRPDDRSISLDVYWQNQTKTINSPNCDKEIIEITRLLNQ